MLDFPRSIYDVYEKLQSVGISPVSYTHLRESQARNFPESNRFLVQVFRVIGGMIPMWHALLHERLLALRRQRNHMVICSGTVFSMILAVIILPVFYWKIFGNK